MGLSTRRAIFTRLLFTYDNDILENTIKDLKSSRKIAARGRESEREKGAYGYPAVTMRFSS